MGRVRNRIGDKRILGLVKAFLKAGVLAEDKTSRETITGTPQGGIRPGLDPQQAPASRRTSDEAHSLCG